MCLGSHELINAAGVESTFGSKTGEARFRLFKKKKVSFAIPRSWSSEEASEEL